MAEQMRDQAECPQCGELALIWSDEDESVKCDECGYFEAAQ